MSSFLSHFNCSHHCFAQYWRDKDWLRMWRIYDGNLLITLLFVIIISLYITCLYLCSALACIVFLLMCCLYPGRCEQSVTNECLALLMRPLGSGGVIKLCTVWPGNNKNVFLIVKRQLNQSLVEMNLICNNVYVHTSASDKASCYISWVTFPNWYRRMTWFIHIIQITIATQIFNIHRVMNISSISPIVDKHDGMGQCSWTP